MRFRIQVEFCVQADTVNEVDELQTRAEEAAIAVGTRLIKDPDHGSVSGGSIQGLDRESAAALNTDEDA